MAMPIVVEDGYLGTKTKAQIDDRGQLIVAPIAYNTPSFNSMTTTSAFNFVLPKAGNQFVLTGYIVATNKDINASVGAIVPIIEADAVDTTTPSSTIITLNLGRLDGREVTGLNILTTPGKWINASTDVTTVNLTLLGYYVKTV